MRLLEGNIVDEPEADDRDEEIRRLTSELAATRAETQRARQESARAVGALRKQLAPLYRALQAVFGEMDDVWIEDAPASVAAGPDARTVAVWNSWKSRMGSAAKIIDALLLHGEMNTQQLAIATGYHRTTIPAMVHKLNKAGLLNKSGGRFSLKQL